MTHPKDPVGAERGDRALWAEANDGQRTIGRRWEPQPYGCPELLAYLNANPERDSALIRAFIKTQTSPVSCRKEQA